jgi:hypothetical protein
VIYSEGDLTIQKYSQYNLDGSENLVYNSKNNKSNLIRNISGQIISYDGNMQIDAKTISNEREISPFNYVLNPQVNGSNAPSESVNQYNWQKNNEGCFGHKCEFKYFG